MAKGIDKSFTIAYTIPRENVKELTVKSLFLIKQSQATAIPSPHDLRHDGREAPPGMTSPSADPCGAACGMAGRGTRCCRLRACPLAGQAENRGVFPLTKSELLIRWTAGSYALLLVAMILGAIAWG